MTCNAQEQRSALAQEIAEVNHEMHESHEKGEADRKIDDRKMGRVDSIFLSLIFLSPGLVPAAREEIPHTLIQGRRVGFPGLAARP